MAGSAVAEKQTSRRRRTSTARARRGEGREEEQARRTAAPRTVRKRQAEAPEPAPEGASGADRFDQLRSAVAEIRTRVASTNVERPLLIIGSILLPTGLVAVLLGWVGASSTPFVFEQVPYLISGGLLGVAMAVVGGFLYFGYWLTKIVQEQRAQSDRLASSLERIEALLGGGGADNGAPATRVPAGSFVATPSGTMFHRPDCVVVSDRQGLRRVKGSERGFEPCGICDPLSD